MSPRLWIPLATFAIGFLCAWLAKPGAGEPPSTDAAEVQEPYQPKPLTAPPREPSARSQDDTRIARLLEGGQDWRPEPDEDYPRLLMALERRAGLSGLDRQGERLLSRIITSWYDANPGGALLWVFGRGNSKDEGELLTEITDNCELGDDFPFREVFEALASEHRPPRLLYEWARRDFAAAWEWSYDGVQSPTQLQGMVEVWTEGAGDDSVAEFAACLMDESNWDPETAKRRNWGREQWQVEHMLIVREMLMGRPSPEVFQSLLERVPNRQESLSRLVRVGAALNTPSADQYRKELLNQMTPNERLAAFGSFEPWVRRVTGMRAYYGEALTLLGHSAEEIEWMLATETAD